MSDKIICSKCGAEMLPINRDKPFGMTCPNCGWGWATTFIDPIKEDETKYTVFLRSGNTLSKDIVKAVSRAANVNVLQARKMLETAPVAVCTDKAVKIREVLKTLEDGSVLYEVEPAFPYPVNDVKADKD